MSQDFTYPIDPVRLATRIASGWTYLSLWYSRYPEGPYSNASVTWSPTTLALMSSGEDYTATATYTSGDPSYFYKIRLYNGSSYSDLSESETFQGGGGFRLRELRESIGKEIRELRTGVCVAGTSTSQVVVQTAGIQRAPTNYYNGWFVNNFTRSAWSVVTASTRNASDNTCTVSPVITAQASGDEIELLRRFTPDEYRDAINWAITTSYPVLGKVTDYREIMTATNIFEYDLPLSIRNIKSVEIESLNNSDSTVQATRGHPWSEIPYEIIQDGIHNRLRLRSYYPPARRLRIVYFIPLDNLYNEADYVNIYGEQLNYLKYLAIHKLYDGMINDGAASDREFFKERSLAYWGKADTLKSRVMTRRPAHHVWQASERRVADKTGLNSYYPWVGIST